MAGFAEWCAGHGLADLAAIEPVHVAAYVEQLQTRLSAPSVKQHLAAELSAPASQPSFAPEIRPKGTLGIPLAARVAFV